jgi:hypothetical protein
MKPFPWLCAALVAFAVPARAETIPPIPFHTAYTYWDHHWLQWLPSHPRFEAIEASIATKAGGGRFIRVWFTERAPPKRQVFYFDDRATAAAMRTGESHYADLRYNVTGDDGAPRGLELHFRDGSGALVSWRVGFPPKATLSFDYAGLKPQGGHSADETFLLFVLGPNVATYDSVTMIGDRAYAVTPESIKADGRYYGAAYTAGAHGGIFNYGTRQVAVASHGAGRIEVARDDGGSLKSYTHRFAGHDMTVALDGGRYAVSFDGGAPVLTGTVEAEPGAVTWRPHTPGWARGVVLRSTFRPIEGGYELTVGRLK